MPVPYVAGFVSITRRTKCIQPTYDKLVSGDSPLPFSANLHKNFTKFNGFPLQFHDGCGMITLS